MLAWRDELLAYQEAGQLSDQRPPLILDEEVAFSSGDHLDSSSWELVYFPEDEESHEEASSEGENPHEENAEEESEGLHSEDEGYEADEDTSQMVIAALDLIFSWIMEM